MGCGLPMGQYNAGVHQLHMQSTMSPATAAAVAAAQKKKGIKSSLGRFFSKKDKVRKASIQSFFSLLAQTNICIYFNVLQIKGKDVSMPGDIPGMGGVSTPDPDYGDIAAGTVAGTLCNKGDFDRRKKKRYGYCLIKKFVN